MINIKSDSRKIKKGDTFIAVKCEINDGHQYIEKAIENGASKIIAERGNYSVETEIVPNTRIYLNEYLKENYNPILNKMNIIGINNIDMVTGGEDLYKKNFDNYSAIYIGGGNTYKLLRDIKENNCFDKIKIPICNHEVYKLIVISKVNKCVVPLIAKKNETYFINIAGNNLNDRKQLITIRLMDANYPNIRIKGGKMIIWQDIQSQ